MKFLCVACDEPMKLNRTLGPDEGSMTIVYRCPMCENETAMLTNSMETQMVRALDIKIGGRSVPKEPMSFIKGSLTGSTLGETKSTETSDVPVANGATTAGKCPFTHAVNEAYATAEAPEPKAITWTQDATARVERIPSYIRPMVMKGVEEYAKSQGITEIDSALMENLKGRFGGM